MEAKNVKRYKIGDISLSSCLHVAMAGGAFVIGKSLDDFNTKTLLLLAAFLFLTLLVSAIDSDEESRVVNARRFVKAGMFCIVCAFVSALLAVVRLHV